MAISTVQPYRPPLLLYVHIPYCVHKCHYCDFNSHAQIAPDWNNYGKALLSELGRWAENPTFTGRNLASIFFGGGTPSLTPPQLISDVIRSAEKLFGFEKNIEITLEANPGTIDADSFSDFRQAGVNRLSIGVQSLNDQELKWLERIHDSRQALSAFDTAREAGFDNINLDLIYGLPNQPLDLWLDSLTKAVNLGSEHLSCYQLTVEPHTKLAASHATKPLPLPDDELSLNMFSETRNRLQTSGFEAYEVSNFALPGLKCRHNDGYWQYHDYIGIGAGASGKWDEQSGGISRYSNIRTPEHYIAAVKQQYAINSSEALSLQQAAAEAVWLGIRRTAGIERANFQRRFGFDVWEHFSEQLEPWKEGRMLKLSNDAVTLSKPGLTLADAIAESVL